MKPHSSQMSTFCPKIENVFSKKGDLLCTDKCGLKLSDFGQKLDFKHSVIWKPEKRYWSKF